MKPLVDGYIVVTLEQTRRAMRLMAEKARIIAEGAGALPLAAALTGKAGQGPIVCGGLRRQHRPDDLLRDSASDRELARTHGPLRLRLRQHRPRRAGGHGGAGRRQRGLRLRLRDRRGHARAAADLVRGLLDADAEVRFVASGTAANAIVAGRALPAVRGGAGPRARPHLHRRDRRAGVLRPGPGPDRACPAPPGGSIRRRWPPRSPQPDVSYRQSPAALSLTNATEYGTVYSAAGARRA